MRVKDVMTEGVRTVPPAMAAEDAWNVMSVEGIHHLVVVDDRLVVGVLSDRDAGGRRGMPLRRGREVRDLMSAPVVTVEPDATVRRTANLMRGRSIGCVVVVEKHRVIGIVTVADLLALLGHGLERPVTQTRRWTLKHRTPHRKVHNVATAW
jgi:predicted transcriptional regulator